MTAVPLPRITRRHKPLPLNHGARPCGICETPSFTEHAAWCNEVTGPQPLNHPAEARVFRGLLIGVPLSVGGWVLAAAVLIWSLL